MLPPAPSHRILIVTDAWLPQVNGVVRTLTTVAEELRAMGHVVEVIGPDRFRTFPCPTYPDIALSLWPRRRLVRMIEAFAPEALHIATEGPLGLAARRWARQHGVAFTTAFHTRFAEYVYARLRIPTRPIYAWMRRFHGAGHGIMVATASLREELLARGFRNIRPWSRGVDLSLFKPEPRDGWRWRRTSPHFSIWTCRARRWWSVADLSLPRCNGIIPTFCLPARVMARHWHAPTPVPTCSYSRR
jgi:glycosyltransferase involved in cell wall biosynthesis